MFLLYQLRKFKLPQELLIQSKSAISTSITIWFDNSKQTGQVRLQQIVKTAVKITATSLPSTEDLNIVWIRRKAEKASADPSHPGHEQFQFLPQDDTLTRQLGERDTVLPLAITRLNIFCRLQRITVITSYFPLLLVEHFQYYYCDYFSVVLQVH